MALKDKALELLGSGETVSGAQLARELGVSRNAVWKVMNQLRQGGYEIDAVTNRGYRLLSAPALLSETEIRRWLTTKELGRELEIHDQLDSTNNRAKTRAAAGAPQGLTVITDSQTGGRGRRGRSFFSPEHKGVYLTCVLRPSCTPEEASLLTSLAAVATARAIEKVADTDVKIKWVNDLYIGDKKVCGILSEAGMNMESGQLDYVVVGIGVNAARMEFPPELKDIATSVGNETGTDPDRNRLIAEILNEMEKLYDTMDSAAFLRESRRRSNVIGREITVIEGERKYPARAVDIDSRGHLIIETAEGRTRLNYGEVSLKLSGKRENEQ